MSATTSSLRYVSAVDHVPRIARLLTFPNVLVTGHQAFFIADALSAIAEATIENISCFEDGGMPANPVSLERLA